MGEKNVFNEYSIWLLNGSFYVEPHTEVAKKTSLQVQHDSGSFLTSARGSGACPLCTLPLTLLFQLVYSALPASDQRNTTHGGDGAQAWK